MKKIIQISAMIASILLFSACSNTIKLDDVPVEERAITNTTNANGNNGMNGTNGVNGTTMGNAQTGQVDPRNVVGLQANTGGNNGRDSLNDPQGLLSKRSIYFDYDSFAVPEQQKAILEAHARFLGANKTRRIVIQGNTDERGGREYNLALGQKRAEAVRRALVLLGVSDGQMEAVSFGKEKPKALGADEAAYAENRRADIVYQ